MAVEYQFENATPLRRRGSSAQGQFLARLVRGRCRDTRNARAVVGPDRGARAPVRCPCANTSTGKRGRWLPYDRARPDTNLCAVTATRARAQAAGRTARVAAESRGRFPEHNAAGRRPRCAPATVQRGRARRASLPTPPPASQGARARSARAQIGQRMVQAFRPVPAPAPGRRQTRPPPGAPGTSRRTHPDRWWRPTGRTGQAGAWSWPGASDGCRCTRARRGCR